LLPCQFYHGWRPTEVGGAFPLKTGFGWIEVGGRTYDHDIIIHIDRSVSRRKKKVSKELKGDYGHTPLSEYELAVLRDEKPDVVYIGTGQYGSLPLTPGAEKILSDFSAVIMPTGEILASLEKEERSHVAILHITC